MGSAFPGLPLGMDPSRERGTERESGTEGPRKWHRGTRTVAQPWHVPLTFLGHGWDRPVLIPVTPVRSCCDWDMSWGTGMAFVTLCSRNSPFQSPARETMGCETFSCFLQKLLQGRVLDLAEVLIRLGEISPRLYCCAQQTGYTVLDDTSAPLS